MKISPSVVIVVGAVILGMVTVELPMMMIPELETIVWPSGKVVVDTSCEFVGIEVGGENVKVSPSVVMVVGAVILGRLIVELPIISTPELEIRVCPSGRVVVNPGGPDGEVDVVDIDGGRRVNVSPSVVSIDSDETVGSVTESVPIMRTPELEIIVLPSGPTIVVGEPPTFEAEKEEEGGKKVKVSPSVISVVGAVTTGIGTVSLPPIISAEELETIV